MLRRVTKDQELPRPPPVTTLLSGSSVDMDRLHDDVTRRGIDAVIEDLRPGGRFVAEASGEGAKALAALLAVLELEVHHLRGWSFSEPAFLLQQVRNRCFERGLWELQVRAEQALSARGWAYLRERVRTDREVSGRIRTLELQKVPGAPWEDRAIGGVALTPDGRLAVASSHDKKLRVWDVETGRLLRTMTGHSDQVRGVAVFDEGRKVISASIDRTLKVWDLESGSALRTLEGHTAGVWGVAVAPDGRSAVSASMDRTVKVWNLESGALRLTFEGHADSVLGVAVCPDGERVVSAAMDGILQVWHLRTGAVVHALRGHKAGVWSVSVSEDGSWAISGSSDRTVRVWNLASGELVDTLEGHTADVTTVKWIGDAWVGSASLDGTVKLWDVSRAELRATWTGRGSGITSIDVTGDRMRAVSGSKDGALEVWSLARTLSRAAGRPESPPVTPGAAGGAVLSHVAVSPGGRWAVAVAADGSLKRQDLLGDSPPRSFAGLQGGERDDRDVRQVQVSEDGRRAVTVSACGLVTVWDLDTGRAALELRCPAQAWLMGVTADTLRAVSPNREGALDVWDLTSGRVVHRVPHAGHSMQSVMLSGDGRRVINVYWEPTCQRCRVWDVASGKELRSFYCGSAPRAISHDGRFAAISAPSYDPSDRVDIWDLDRGIGLGRLQGSWTMAMSWDGRKIASVEEGVVVSDVRTAARLATVKSQAPFSCCAFTPDGRTLVAGDRAGMIHVLDEWPAGW